MATGVGFGFDTDFLKTLAKADAALNDLMDKNNLLSKSAITAYKQMSEKGVIPYVQSLEKELSILNELQRVITDSSGRAKRGFGEMKSSIVSATDSINKMLDALYKVQGANSGLGIKIGSIRESREMETTVGIRTGGKTWGVSAEDVIKEHQARLEAFRKYRSEMISMYESMFDEIDRKEKRKTAETKKAADEVSNYERKQYEDSLNRYKRQKDEQARVDKHYHDKRQRELEEVFRKEEQLIAQQSRSRADRYAYTQRFGDTSGQAIAAYNRLYDKNGLRSIQQMQSVLSKLQQAQQKLNLDTEEGKKKYSELGAKIKQVQISIERATGASEKFKNSQNSLTNTTAQLGRQLATIFSIQQLVNYAQKVVDIRKEFELQHKSLQIIIQDQDKANKLWQQTVDLALQSPFRVKELVKYTKQLAAYRIETGKLHETTKMLADVSAGLGVDMQRLILAYGQVRAAEFLRGTELRQFTEAGVPMLDELAKHFTDLEGKAVSTAEVFSRISKRQVLFADVEAVLKKMTSENGVFYRMQEQQAETLYGMISNFHDSLDLMMNDIGKANDELMKDMVRLAKSVVDNWRVVLSVIEQIGIVLAILGAKQIAIFSRGFAVATTNAALATKSLSGMALAGAKTNVIFSKLFSLIKAHPFLSIGTAIGAAALSLTKFLLDHNKAVEAANEQYDELSRAAVRSIDKLNGEELNKYNKEVEANNEILKDATSSEDEIRKARSSNANILEELKIKYKENFKNLEQNTNGTIELTNAINEQVDALKQQIFLNELSKGNFFLEDAQKNYKDAVTAFAEVENAIISVKASMIDLKKELILKKESGEISDADYNALISQISLVESAKGYDEVNAAVGDLYTSMFLLENQGKIAKETYSDFTNTMQGGLSKLGKATVHFNRDTETFGKNLDKYIDNVRVGVSDLQDNVAKSKWIDDLLKRLGYSNDEIRKWAGEYISKKIGIEFVFPEVKKDNTADEILLAWQEEFNKTFEGYAGFVKITQAEVTQKEKLREVQALITDQGDLIKRMEGAAKGAYSNYDIEKERKALEQLKEIEEWLGGYDKGGGGGTGEDIYAKRIKMIRDMAKAFEDLNKTFASGEAEIKVIESYTDAFNDLFAGIMDISSVDFKSPQGVVDALRTLGESGSLTAKQMRDLRKAIAEEMTQIDVKDKGSQSDAMLQTIENMFGQYELSIELQKLQVPTDFAEDLFGIETKSLAEISRKIQEELTSGVWGADAVKKLKEFQRKVTEMEVKEQQERLKKYLVYTKESIGERAKIKLEELKKLEEIELTFDKEKATADLEDYERIEREKQRAILGVQKEASAEMQKLEWEQFKSSDVFIEMFNDLENVSGIALKKMIEQLEEYKDEWTNLPVDQMKEVAKQLERMKSAQEEREALENPFDGGFMKIPSSEERQNAEIQILNTTKMISDINASIANDELKMQEYAEGKLKLSKEEYNQLVAHKAGLVSQLGILGAYLSKQQNIVKEYDLQFKKLKAQGEAIDDIMGMANDLYDAFVGLSEALGADSDSPAMIFAEMGMSMADTVSQTLMLQTQLIAARSAATGFGLAMNTAMGVIGWIVMGVQLLTQAISAIVEAHDNNIQKQIEAEQQYVDNLAKKYDNLAKSIDNAYNIHQLENYAAQSRYLSESIIDSYERMIALERAKKRTDEEKLEEYYDTIAEEQEKLAERQKELFSEVTDSVLDSPKDAASDWVDAWLESFAEVGDGMVGLEENFDEMIATIIKKQMALSVVSPYLERWKQQLENYINAESGDLTFSLDDANAFKKLIESDLPMMNESMENWYNTWGGVANLLGDAGGELSGLTKGIQGITETQAEEISAYLNSLRYYVASNSQSITELAQKILSNDDTVNPMLSQLRIIATQTTAINDLLGSLTKSGHSMGGVGMKVFIN